MAEQTNILVLRDETGTPFLIPREVVEREELVAFRVANDDYLLPRKQLLDSEVSDEAVDEDGGLSVRTQEGAHFRLSAETLDHARVSTPEGQEAAANMFEDDVVAHSLDFDISPLGDHELGMTGRGFGRAFIS